MSFPSFLLNLLTGINIFEEFVETPLQICSVLHGVDGAAARHLALHRRDVPQALHQQYSQQEPQVHKRNSVLQGDSSVLK